MYADGCIPDDVMYMFKEIIQEEVAHPALHQGRKFMIRSYFIVFGGVLYVSKHAGCILHGLPYDLALLCS